MEGLKDPSSSSSYFSNRTSSSVAAPRSGDDDGEYHLVGAPLSAEAAADAQTATGGGNDGVPRSPRGAKLVCAMCRTKAAAKSCAFQCCSGCCPSSTLASPSSLSRHEEEAGGGQRQDAAENVATHDDKDSSSSAAAIAFAAAAPSSSSAAAAAAAAAARVCEYHQRARIQSEFRKRVLEGTTSAQLLAKQIRARQLPPGRFREKRFAYQGDTVRIWDWSAFGSSHPKALEEAVRKSAKRRKQTMRHPPHGNDDNNDHPAANTNDDAHRTGATATRRPRRQDRFGQFLDARLADTKHPPKAA
jgi:hypothetical protein